MKKYILVIIPFLVKAMIAIGQDYPINNNIDNNDSIWEENFGEIKNDTFENDIMDNTDIIVEVDEYEDSIAKHYSNYKISEKIENIFKKADADGNNKLSRKELAGFQNWLVMKYKYKNNKRALTPDEFIEQGGGDCEDFAIVTSMLLRYFGENSKVAGFGKVTVRKHAVAIWILDTPPKNYSTYYYKRNSSGKMEYYLPIDYNVVGGLSAIDRRWKIAWMTEPEKLFGKIM